MTPRMYVDYGCWWSVSHIQLVAALVIFCTLLYILWTGSRQNGQKQQSSSSLDTDHFAREAPLCEKRVKGILKEHMGSDCFNGRGEFSDTHTAVAACDCCPKSGRRRDESNNIKSLCSSCGRESFSFCETGHNQNFIGNRGIYWKKHEDDGNVGCSSNGGNAQKRYQHKAREDCRCVSPQTGRESRRWSRSPGQDRGKDHRVTFQDSKYNVFRKEDGSITRQDEDDQSWSQATLEGECNELNSVNVYQKISDSINGKDWPVVRRHPCISNWGTNSDTPSDQHCIKGGKCFGPIDKGSRSFTCIADSRDTSQKFVPVGQLFYRPRPTVTGQSCYLASRGQSQQTSFTGTTRESCLSGVLDNSGISSKYTRQSSLSSLPFACTRCGCYLSPSTFKKKSSFQNCAKHGLSYRKFDVPKCSRVLSSFGAFGASSRNEITGCHVSLIKRQPLRTCVGQGRDHTNQGCEQSSHWSQPPRGTYLSIQNEAGNERSGTRSDTKRTELSPRRVVPDSSACALDLGSELSRDVTPGQVCAMCGIFEELEKEGSTCQYAEVKVRSGRIILDDNTSRHVMSTQEVGPTLIKPRSLSI